MSKYTTEVRFICESVSGLRESKGYNSVEEVITNALPKVFDFDFPIFDENYRGVLERKILKHYYTREICEETVGLWKLRLNTRLNEIMPYYNKLYNSELLEFDPFNDVNYTRSGKKDTVGSVKDVGGNTSEGYSTTSMNDTVNSRSVDKYSDTPQGGLTDLENDRYLTNARLTDNNGSMRSDGATTTETEGTTKNDRDIKNTDEYVETIVGKISGANYSELLVKFRDTFLNIDMLVVRDLEDLFLQLW